MKQSKWFEFHGKDFDSKRRSKSLREAFDKSLEKWRLICNGFCTTDDVDTCGLCDLYWKENCKSCPIYKITHTVECEGTPFNDWSRNYSLKYAKRELGFLEFIQKEFMR